MTDRDVILRAEAVVGNMTLDEKVALCICGKDLLLHGVERLKVPDVKLPVELDPFSATSLSGGGKFFALGCSFDVGLAAEAGRLREREADEKGEAFSGVVPVGVIRYPMANGAENCFGEDAELVTELAAAYASAVTLPPIGVDVGGTLGKNPALEPRARNEIYFRPSEKLKAKLGGFKVAEGVESPVGFSGADHTFAVGEYASRGGAVETLKLAPAVTVGGESDAAALKVAVENGTLQEKRLDTAATRVLYAAYKRNESDKRTDKKSLSTDEIEAVKRRFAEESAVLLENNDKTLPLGNAPAAYFGFGKKNEKEGSFSFPVRCNRAKLGKLTAAYSVAVVRVVCENAVLPTGTTETLAALRDIGKKVVVVLVSPRPVELGLSFASDALLFVPYENEFSFGAVKDIISGRISPSGRLPVSWAHKADYPVNAYSLCYGRAGFCYESVYNGYRYFSAFGVKPVFPFGHGLSYLDWSVSNVKIKADGEKVTVSMTVANASETGGEIALPVFVSAEERAPFGFDCKLAAFTRVSLGGGETTSVEIPLLGAAFEVFDKAKNAAVFRGGKYKLTVGAADAEPVASFKVGGKVKLEGLGEKDLPSYYSRDGFFTPLASDVERLLGTRPISAVSVEPEARRSLTVCTVKRAYRKEICAAVKTAKSRSYGVTPTFIRRRVAALATSLPESGLKRILAFPLKKK